METHNRQFFDCVVHFDRVFSNLDRYHNSRAITVEQTGTANKTHWPVATHKDNEITTETHHEQQNLQLNSCPKKSFCAWICNHSIQRHLTASPNRNAAAKATTATQHTNSIIPNIIRQIPRCRRTGTRQTGASKIDYQFPKAYNHGKYFRPFRISCSR